MYYIYSYLFLPFALLLAHFFALFSRKIRQPLWQRYHVLKKISTIKSTFNNIPTILIHTASMGEFEHIKPLINSINKSLKVNIVITFFSPSGYDIVKEYDGIKLFLYLPFDFPRTWKKFYSLTNTKLLLISKHDVWPNQIKIANSINIPSILVNASLSEQSSRNNLFSKLILSSAYSSMDKIFVISDNDAQRFQKIFKCNNTETIGDTKFDQVFLRKNEIKEKNLLSKEWYTGNTIILFGSIWPQDIDNVLIYMNEILDRFDKLKIIITPHQPNDDIILQIRRNLNGFIIDLFSETVNNNSRVLIIDKIGILADLYRYADIAYVGGSFKQGIHNVMEPAIYGIPVLFGPLYRNSYEAKQLLVEKGALSIENKEQFRDIIINLLKNNSLQNQIGENASSFAKKNIGATDKIIRYIQSVL